MLLQTDAGAPAWVPDFLFRPEPIICVQQALGPGYAWLFRAFDVVAGPWGVLFVLGLALWKWGRDDLYALSGLVAVEAVLNTAINRVLYVPRPSAADIIQYEHLLLGSFPSGHVLSVAAVWGLLWLRGRVPLWLVALLVIPVAVGRLYLGVHYLADVVAGAVLAALLILAFRALWRRAYPWLARRSWRFFLRAGVASIAIVAAGAASIQPRSDFLFGSAGVGAGGIVAMLIEYRAVRFTPRPAPWPRTVGLIAVGLLGMAPLYALYRVSPEHAPWLAAALTFTASLWALLAAPAVFQRLGWGDEITHSADRG